MKILDGRLITCILPPGQGRELLSALKEELGITTAFTHLCRGVGFSGATRRQGIAEQLERQLLLVAVESDRADEAFEFLYRRGGLDQPHAGFMFMERLRFTPMGLP